VSIREMRDIVIARLKAESIAASESGDTFAIAQCDINLRRIDTMPANGETAEIVSPGVAAARRSLSSAAQRYHFRVIQIHNCVREE